MKAKMPEPDAYLYVNGDQRGVSLHFRSDQDIAAGTSRHTLITTDQAEAYAAAVRREALEEVVSLLEARFFKNQMQIERAIRALIQRKNKS